MLTSSYKNILILFFLCFFPLCFFPGSAAALSCAYPAHRVLAYCENETCFEGFRVYYLETAFPCETKAVSEEITDFHRDLFYHFSQITQRSLPSGVREISFIACTKENVEQIPWKELERQAASGTDWSEFAVNESEWQVRRTEKMTLLLGRSSGCAISFHLSPRAESRDALEDLREEYVGSPFWTSLWYHLRLWIWPLIFVPIFAAVLFLLINLILKWAKERPFRLVWITLPLLLQLCLLATVLGPATNRWMGPYRLFFFIPCALLFIFWLITLLRVWMLLAPHLDALSPKKEEEEEESDEN